tara:strand:+ start:43 stop:2133 length:2091 start_codon:yes stop_codon:yes gene_type:complete
MPRNVKQKDFDYYLTNLDWGDGTEIDREITQFTRNDVFEHNYERPGFYSINGLVFKYNELGIEALGNPDVSMDAAGWEEVSTSYPNGFPNPSVTKRYVQTNRTVTELSSSMSTFQRRPSENMDTRYQIVETYKSTTPIYIGSSVENQYNSVGEHLTNCVVGEIEKRPHPEAGSWEGNNRLNGISISIPITLDVSEIDYLQYSFEVNLPNPNLNTNGVDTVIQNTEPNWGKKSSYRIREKLYTPKADGTVDWSNVYLKEKTVQGIGGSNQDPNRSSDVKNGGWQRIQGVMFVQERPEKDSDDNEINDEDFKYNIIYMLLEIIPQADSVPLGYTDVNYDTWDRENKDFIGIRNLSFKTPNTENIIRPVEWQRFYSNIVVNPRDDYDSPLYEENDFALIGGLSKESVHFKSLSSLLAYDIDEGKYKSDVRPDYNQYDLLAMYDTFAKYDDKLYNELLTPYTKKIHEDYAPYYNKIDENNNLISQSLYNKKSITNGMFNKDFHGAFDNTYITDVDIGSTKMFKSVKPMWEQLGFDNSNYDNPSLNGYWKNIIPNDFQLDDKEGIVKQDLPDPERGALTPRIPREEYVFISGSSQEWNDGYYWPVLPLINHVGIFEDDVNTSLYGDESISNATNIVDSDMNLIFNLNFDVDEVDELQDSTNTTNIRYSTDSLLLLDDNKRVFKDTEDITDTIEKDIRRQAF